MKCLLLRLSASLCLTLVATGFAFADSPRIVPLQSRARRHVRPLRLEDEVTSEVPPTLSPPVTLPAVQMAPTRSSFLANWAAINGATHYRIDVSDDPSFKSYIGDYEAFDVGNVTSQIICHLKPATKYYYRVRASGSNGMEMSSAVMTAETTATSGLVINPTFDTSITSNPNAAAIESTINKAVAIYQNLFSDPITVEIRFRYANTQPDGTAFPAGVVAESWYVIYYVLWSSYTENLKADAKTPNDSSANTNLPNVPLTTYLVPSSADGRAVNLDTPPAMFANGTVGTGGPYDGIVTLNSNEPFQFTRPPSSGNFDAQQAFEHEIDEVLGLGSYLGGSPEDTDFRPQDLFSWSAPGTRSHSAVGTRYFSIDNGVTKIVDFSQDPQGDFGDWASEPCPQTHPYVQNEFGCKGQFSDVTATSPEGINLDVVGYDLASAITPTAPILGNISTRCVVGTNDKVLIGGFIIDGTQPKKVILLAVGPSLPLTGTLPNPYLELHDASGAIIASNDNWRSDQEAEILQSGLAPANDFESAIVTSLEPGSYTAIVRGSQNGSGIGSVEVYDLDQSVDSTLANISTRGLVQTDNNVMIAGFIIQGGSSAGTIVLALGPSLPVTGPLLDPTLELHDSDGAIITSNDNWRTDEAEVMATGLAPSNDAESAIVATLSPGGYTAIVRGQNNTTGLALVEVYQLHN